MASAITNLIASLGATAHIPWNETTAQFQGSNFMNGVVHDIIGSNNGVATFAYNPTLVSNPTSLTINNTDPCAQFTTAVVQFPNGSTGISSPYNATNNFRWWGVRLTTNVNQYGPIIVSGDSQTTGIGWQVIQNGQGSLGTTGNLLSLVVSKSGGSAWQYIVGSYVIQSGVPFAYSVEYINGVWTFCVSDPVTGFQVLGTTDQYPFNYNSGSPVLRFGQDQGGNTWAGEMQHDAFWTNATSSIAIPQQLAATAFLTPPGAPLLQITTGTLENTLSIPVAVGTGTYGLFGYNLYSGPTSGGEASTPIATLIGSTGNFTAQNVPSESTSIFYNSKAIDTSGNYSAVSNEVSATTPTEVDLPLVMAPVALNGPSIAQRNITIPQFSAPTIQFSFVDQNNNAINLTGYNLAFVCYNIEPTGVSVFNFEYDALGSSGGSGSITINNNLVNVEFALANTQLNSVNQAYSIWDKSNPLSPIVLVNGSLVISPAAYSSTIY